MFAKKDSVKPFSKKVYLSSPTMHGEELRYMQKAYETNWMSTVGENINQVEELAAKQAGVKYAVALCNCTSALHLCVKFAAEAMGAFLHGKPCGSFGDYAAVSYNGNKIIAGSSGGCLLTKDLEVANKARKWST